MVCGRAEALPIRRGPEMSQEPRVSPESNDAPAAVPPPPRPDFDSWGKRGEAWERGWAITGIVFAFLFNVIPGWFALRAYRRWQRGERKRPTGLIVFGILATAMSIVGSLLMGMGGYEGY